MSFTLAGNNEKDLKNSYVKESILQIIKSKPYVATLPMSDILKLWGIDDLVTMGDNSLNKKMEARGEMLIIKGYNFENNGPGTVIEIKGTQYWNNDIFELQPVITGSVVLQDDDIICFDNLGGILFGNSFLRWIKVIPERGVYFRRSWIKNDYFLDWHYTTESDECKVGIPKEIETIVGLW